MTLYVGLLIFVAFYFFFAGLMAEHEHSRMLSEGKKDVDFPSLKIGLLWPFYFGRIDK